MNFGADIDELLAGPETKKTPCARCGAAGECEVWGHPVCYPCTAHWWDEAPDPASVPMEQHAEAYRAFTVAWVNRRKKANA